MTKPRVVIKTPKKTMSRREAISLILGGMCYLGATYEHGEEPIFNLVDKTYEFLGLNPVTKGFVVSSNKDFMHTKLNLEVLNDKDYRNTYVQKVKVKGDTFYRTIVGTTDRNHEKTLEKLVKDEHFKEAQTFFPIKHEELLTLTQESKSNRKKIMKQMEEEFKLNVEKIRKKENYINLINSFIHDTHYNYNREKIKKKKMSELSQRKVREIAGYMYDATKEFNIPRVEYAALISHESKFTNKLGDLKHFDKKNPSKSDHSEGYIQMRINTQRWVLKKMKKEGITGLPDKIPYNRRLSDSTRDTLLNHPELQFRMGAWYFGYCLKKSGWDGKSTIIKKEIIDQAINKYNMGPSTTRQNERYKREVEKEKERIEELMPEVL